MMNSRQSSLQPCQLNKLIFIRDNFSLLAKYFTAKEEFGKVEELDVDVSRPSWC